MYALVDCNNFYVSCERFFQPQLEGRPVIVLSNNDGCAISRSDEAKALGIQMGAVPHLTPALFKTNNVKMFSSNYTLYGDMSDRVMKILATFVPAMEIYSIDEAFLDMSELAYQDLFKLGLEIKRTIKMYTGIPVCVGIAPTKALAKMANRYAKKKDKALGVYWAADQDLINEMLKSTEVNDVWGIGHQYALMLRRNNITTALEFIEAPEDFVRDKMSVVGLRLQKELKGINAIDWEWEPKKKKGICVGRSFGVLTSDKAFIEQAVSNFAASCALKLRKQQSCTGKIRIFITTNPHRTQDEQYYHSIEIKMEVASNETTAIIKYALKGLSIIFKPGLNYMKCGVEVHELVSENEIQLGMFSSTNPKSKKLNAALDKVNDVFGKDFVRFGIQGFDKRYKARAAYLSPCYTTRMNDILKIKR